MKKLLLIALTTGLLISTRAQDNKIQNQKPVEFKLSGFIMNNMFFDTRRNAEALDGMVLLFPLPELRDSKNEDLNQVPTLTLLSFATRLRLGISGPDAFGAKTSGVVELDFTARANSVTVRFRQAWVKFNWEQTELLIGRAWHPLVATEVVPSVMALGAGAPFQPFNRSDQLTLTRKMGKFDLIVSALYQNDYMNNGPLGRSYTYQNNALIPNLHAQLKYKTDKVILGFGLDYKRLKPRTFVESPVDKAKTKTNAKVDGAAILAYGQIKSGKLTLSAKTVLAANTSESLMIGAFGVSSYDTLTGHEEYTSYKHFFIWGNISYGQKVKASLFAGYLKNLGAGKDIVAPYNANPTIWGLGETIGNMLRFAPTVSYTTGKIILALEVEHNIAAYGVVDYTDKGKIKHLDPVSGTRVLATMYYNF